VDEGRPRFEASRRQGTELTDRFLAAVRGGDMEPFIDLLAPDVVMMGDGGGKAPAAATPLYGRDRVARLLRGLTRQLTRWVSEMRPAQVNGQPGVVAYGPDGNLFAVMVFDVLDGQVVAIRSVVNPDKLRHLA
jgi:RNA polymerase sigma-70 factor (ECF subfamily)